MRFFFSLPIFVSYVNNFDNKSWFLCFIFLVSFSFFFSGCVLVHVFRLVGFVVCWYFFCSVVVALHSFLLLGFNWMCCVAVKVCITWLARWPIGRIFTWMHSVCAINTHADSRCWSSLEACRNGRIETYSTATRQCAACVLNTISSFKCVHCVLW